MRIDIVLNKLCIVKTRSIAKNACDKKAIILNDKPAKASNETNIGDIIQCNMFGFITTIRLIEIPEGNVAKKDVMKYYEIISREKVEI